MDVFACEGQSGQQSRPLRKKRSQFQRRRWVRALCQSTSNTHSHPEAVAQVLPMPAGRPDHRHSQGALQKGRADEMRGRQEEERRGRAERGQADKLETESETRKRGLIVIDGGRRREKDKENEVLGEPRKGRGSKQVERRDGRRSGRTKTKYLGLKQGRGIVSNGSP